MTDENPLLPQPTGPPGVDKLMSWGLSGTSALALTAGAWFFSSLDESVKSLGREISDLHQRIAVLQVDHEEQREIKQELREVRARVRALERHSLSPPRNH